MGKIKNLFLYYLERAAANYFQARNGKLGNEKKPRNIIDGFEKKRRKKRERLKSIARLV